MLRSLDSLQAARTLSGRSADRMPERSRRRSDGTTVRPALVSALRCHRLRAGFDESKIKRDDQGQFDDTEAAAADIVDAPEVRGSDQAREAATKYVGKPLTNGDSKIVATVSGATLGKMLSASSRIRSDDPIAHLNAVANLDRLFPHAIPRESRDDNQGGNVIQQIHHFEVPMAHEGRLWRVKIMAKEFARKEDGTRIYHLRAVQIEKPASGEEAPSSTESKTGTTSHAGFDEKFDALAAAVKTAVQKRDSAKSARVRPSLLKATREVAKTRPRKAVPVAPDKPTRLVAAIRKVRATGDFSGNRAAAGKTPHPHPLPARPGRGDQAKMRFAAGGGWKLRARSTRRVRRFTGCAYTGGVMYPSLTVNGVTTCGPVVLDLESLRVESQSVPVLDDHDESTDGTIGRTLSIMNSGRRLDVKGVVYPRKLRSHGIIFANDAGHRWQLSVGTDQFSVEKIASGRSIDVNGRTFTGPLDVIRGAYLTDLSFVAVGGDDRTSATIAASRRRSDGTTVAPSLRRRDGLFKTRRCPWTASKGRTAEGGHPTVNERSRR
jgi:hypothetical protein